MQLILSKIRASARILLTLPENDSKRISQGESLLRRLKKFGIIKQDENTLERILTLKIQISPMSHIPRVKCPIMF